MNASHCAFVQKNDWMSKRVHTREREWIMRIFQPPKCRYLWSYANERILSQHICVCIFAFWKNCLVRSECARAFTCFRNQNQCVRSNKCKLTPFDQKRRSRKKEMENGSKMNKRDQSNKWSAAGARGSARERGYWWKHKWAHGERDRETESSSSGGGSIINK